MEYAEYVWLQIKQFAHFGSVTRIECGRIYSIRGMNQHFLPCILCHCYYQFAQLAVIHQN